MSSLMDRVAGAPITWGVCEVPGWGIQLESERVLEEIESIGLRATERGPDGFLPAEPEQLRARLRSHGLALIGGFVPAILHLEDRRAEQLESVRRSAELLAASGSPVLVLAADAGRDGYAASAPLSGGEWATLIGGIDRVMEVGRELALVVALHPHHGTLIEGPREVEELLARSPVALCLDTGHLMVGGADPMQIATAAPERIAHVHLKDVDAGLADRVRLRRVRYHEAVKRGLYRPLGAGEAGIAEVVAALEHGGYRGWYVIEQDTVLEERPERGAGPVRDAAASVEFLRHVASEIEVVPEAGEPDQPDGGGRSQEASPKSREEVGR